jgi:hypothetical protein
MTEIHEPGQLAHLIELELIRFEHASGLFRIPAGMTDLADALGRVAEMLREAEARGQSVDLGDEVVRLIHQFRATLRTTGGAPAEA